ncbi:MAG: sigma factor-like helix-turn-helix DNA-binding protein [Pyrinomonadaceae bacterium]
MSLVVQKAVASLPLQQREVIVLFEFEEISLAEIALIVDADVNAVKSRLWRARQRLRTLLAPYVERKPHRGISSHRRTQTCADEEKKVPQPPLMSEHMPDKDLEFLLASWVIPEVPPALDERVINSYRRELGVSEEKAMKKCPTCQQVYANQFAFCPADATPLGGVVIGDAAATIERGRRGDYHLTILADESLSQRLTRAAREVGRESRLTWPEFKRRSVRVYVAPRRGLRSAELDIPVAPERGRRFNERGADRDELSDRCGRPGID